MVEGGEGIPSLRYSLGIERGKLLLVEVSDGVSCFHFGGEGML